MTWRLMTWNVQNLFEVGTPDGPPSQEVLDEKLASLAAVIDAAGPDVLCLQEIGSDAALQSLQAVLTTPMPHALTGLPDSRGIRVALLSRTPLAERVDITRFPAGLLPVQAADDPSGPDGPPTIDEMGRGGLQATVTVDGDEVRVIACHLKSKLLSFPDDRFAPRDEGERARYAAYALFRRTGEATTLRSHLNDLLDGGGRDRAVVLAGDLNDDPDAATTQILNGPPGSEIGTQGFETPDQGDGDRMWNLAPLLPEGERSTRRYRGRDEIIDHVFVSRLLVARVTSVHTVAAMAVLPSITDDPRARRAQPGSDHAAVVATFGDPGTPDAETR